jgi:hypothetical protein
MHLRWPFVCRPSGSPDAAASSPTAARDEVAKPPPADEVVKLAYEAAVTYLAQQDVSLGDLRNRATWLVTAAGILATLATNLGLLNTDPNKGPVASAWLTYSLLMTVALIGLAVVGVIWPVKNWTFAPAAAVLLEYEGWDETRIRRAATASLCQQIQNNDQVYRRRYRFLSIGFVLLIVEILVILVGQMIE